MILILEFYEKEPQNFIKSPDPAHKLDLVMNHGEDSPPRLNRWYLQLLKNGLQFQHSIEKWNRFLFTVPLFIVMVEKDSFKVDMLFCFWCNNLYWDNTLSEKYICSEHKHRNTLESGVANVFNVPKSKIIWKKLTLKAKLYFLSLNIYCFVLKHSKARFLWERVRTSNIRMSKVEKLIENLAIHHFVKSVN